MSRSPKLSIEVLAALLAVATAVAAHGAPVLIEHVQGYTLAADRLRSFTALVFDSGKVVETGTTADLSKRYRDAQVIDGQGRCLLPGLIDAHGHVFDLGFDAVQVQLSDTQSLSEAQRRIRAYAAANPTHAWLQGDGWNQVRWKLGRFPLASELDAAVPDRPAVLSRVDGHAVWLNSKALQAADITRHTADPAGRAHRARCRWQSERRAGRQSDGARRPGGPATDG